MKIFKGFNNPKKRSIPSVLTKKNTKGRLKNYRFQPITETYYNKEKIREKDLKRLKNLKSFSQSKVKQVKKVFVLRNIYLQSV